MDKTPAQEIINEMKGLIEELNNASYEYYQKNNSVMSDKQYDELYDRLALLETETGVILSRSPTQRVGHEVVTGLKKVRHKNPLLSLDKTKELEKLVAFLEDETGVLSWKLDGLTVVLSYSGGKLQEALTRGNGEIGEDITQNAKCFKNIPLKISYTGEVHVRGEAIITFSEFARINSRLSDELKYKNPRNLTSGTVRQLDSAEMLKRNVVFFAFNMTIDDETNDAPFGDSKTDMLKLLSDWGFDAVESIHVTKDNILSAVEDFKQKIPDNDFATDGLVLTFDSIEYGKSLGQTSKFPRDSIAFKWADEIAETTLTEVEWNTSRTGLINPVAVFEEVWLEGTAVSRASVHNAGIVRELMLGYGDKITVYKANMIIPQIYENLTRSGTVIPPEKCPACGDVTELRKMREQDALYCKNDDCPAKNISFLEHFVSRNAMNIEGLSVSTIEKFVAKGYIKSYSDFYRLNAHYDEIKKLEGFGEKSVRKIDEALEKSKQTTLHNFIFALGIKNIGLSGAKLLCRHFSYDYDKIKNADSDELMQIDGFGETIANSFTDYFANERNAALADELYDMLSFENPVADGSDNQGKGVLTGITVVITGDLSHFENRKQLQDKIENLGGKVTGLVTGKTNYLINNDVNSGSSKNKKAKELGVTILSEEDFMEKFSL